ncbi:MAG: nucleoside hydrolase [Tunicatimonas sp.]|uniref:nucleoside hydrolase n=1 Tax=Tunicatimonas sp. TaxID=1940096 RepID=UPI003C781264
MLRNFLATGLLLFSIPVFAQQFPLLPVAQRIDRLSPPETPLRVVIDTDTYNEIDDQFAVVYALFSPEQLTVEAIYAAPFKNHRSKSAGEGMEKSYEEILRLLKRTQTPVEGFVYRGSNEFLLNTEEPVESEAAQDLIDRAMSSDEPLYVLTLGAPTNVASAILMEPSIREKIVVVWLGGKGLNWPSANEFNLKQDVLSSQVMFDSGVPLVQIPTQPVTSHLLLSIPEAEKYLKGQGDIGDYLLEIFSQYPTEVDADEYAWSKVVWDISAVAYAINPNWFQSELRATPILTDEKTYSFDNRRPLYRTVTYLNRDKIFGDMFRKIEQQAK